LRANAIRGVQLTSSCHESLNSLFNGPSSREVAEYLSSFDANLGATGGIPPVLFFGVEGRTLAVRTADQFKSGT
jgi:hypothetical protein